MKRKAAFLQIINECFVQTCPDKFNRIYNRDIIRISLLTSVFGLIFEKFILLI